MNPSLLVRLNLRRESRGERPCLPPDAVAGLVVRLGPSRPRLRPPVRPTPPPRDYNSYQEPATGAL